MPEVLVELHLELRSRGKYSQTIYWRTTVQKPDGWTRADFEPFILEDRIDDPQFGTRVTRYPLEIVSADPAHGTIIATYSVPASKCAGIERCLYGTGWEKFGRSTYQRGGR